MPVNPTTLIPNIQKVRKTREMLIMLTHGFEKVAKTREMLIMLIMFIPGGKFGQTTKRINIINIFLVLATFLTKSA